MRLRHLFLILTAALLLVSAIVALAACAETPAETTTPESTDAAAEPDATTVADTTGAADPETTEAEPLGSTAESGTLPSPETTEKPGASGIPEIVTRDPNETTAPEVTTEPEPDIPEPSDLIDRYDEVALTMTKVWDLANYVDSNSVNCRIIQGGCTDGTYLFVAFNDGKSSSSDSISAIRKYNIETKTLVNTYENLKISHCNDITYNPVTNELLMVHNSPDREHVSIYDADTMTFKRMITLENLEIYSMAYDPYEQCYWVGISRCYKFAKLDFNFKQIGETYEGVETGYTKQGMDIDSKYIYFLQYGTNCIMVYDKKGNFVEKLLLPKASNEPENICHIGDDFYVAYLESSKGGTMYLVEITEKLPDPVEVEMESFMTLPSYTDAAGTVYAMPQGVCSDGTYLYVAFNKDGKSVIRKIDPSTKTVVGTYEGLSAGLTNDLVYNPKTDRILAVYNGNERKKVAVYDADTLSLVETVTLSRDIYAMTYCEKENCYFVGLSGGYTYAKLNASFEMVGGEITGPDLGNTKQGMYCDGTYFYMVMSKSNAIAAYRVSDGAFVGCVALPETENAAQSLCKIGDTFYVVYHASEGGAIIYTAEITVV